MNRGKQNKKSFSFCRTHSETSSIMKIELVFIIRTKKYCIVLKMIQKRKHKP